MAGRRRRAWPRSRGGRHASCLPVASPVFRSPGNGVSRERRARVATSCLEFCMLRITQQSSPDVAKDYYASADYYAEGQENVGRWGGEGARLLGLEGEVDPG